jgi:hypothetical protein
MAVNYEYAQNQINNFNVKLERGYISS